MDESTEKHVCLIKKKRCGPLRQKLYNVFCDFIQHRTLPTAELLIEYKFRPALYLKEIWRKDIVKQRMNTLAAFKKWSKKMALKEAGVLEVKTSRKIILPKEKFRKAILAIHSRGNLDGSYHLAYQGTRIQFCKRYAIDKHEFGIGKKKFRRIISKCPSPGCRVRRFKLTHGIKESSKPVETSTSETSSDSERDSSAGDDASSVSSVPMSDHETSGYPRLPQRHVSVTGTPSSSATTPREIGIITGFADHWSVKLEEQDRKIGTQKLGGIAPQLLLPGVDFSVRPRFSQVSQMRENNHADMQRMVQEAAPKESIKNSASVFRVVQDHNNNYQTAIDTPFIQAGLVDLGSSVSPAVVDLCSSGTTGSADRLSPDFFDHVGCDDEMTATQAESDVTLSAPSNEPSPAQSCQSPVKVMESEAQALSAFAKVLHTGGARSPSDDFEKQAFHIMFENARHDTDIPIEIKPAVMEPRAEYINAGSNNDLTGVFHWPQVERGQNLTFCNEEQAKEKVKNTTSQKRTTDSKDGRVGASNDKKRKASGTTSRGTKAKKTGAENALSKSEKAGQTGNNNQCKKSILPVEVQPKQSGNVKTTVQHKKGKKCSVTETCCSRRRIQIVPVVSPRRSDEGSTSPGQPVVSRLPSPGKLRVVLQDPIDSPLPFGPKVIRLPAQPLSKIPFSNDVQIVRPTLDNTAKHVAANEKTLVKFSKKGEVICVDSAGFLKAVVTSSSAPVDPTATIEANPKHSVGTYSTAGSVTGHPISTSVSASTMEVDVVASLPQKIRALVKQRQAAKCQTGAVSVRKSKEPASSKRSKGKKSNANTSALDLTQPPCSGESSHGSAATPHILTIIKPETAEEGDGNARPTRTSTACRKAEQVSEIKAHILSTSTVSHRPASQSNTVKESEGKKVTDESFTGTCDGPVFFERTQVAIDLEKEFDKKASEVCRLYNEQIMPNIRELKQDMKVLSAAPAHPYAHVLNIQNKLTMLSHTIAIAKLNVEEVGVRLKQKQLQMTDNQAPNPLRRHLLDFSSSSSLSDVDLE